MHLNELYQFFMKGAVLKTLKKLSFHHTFDFDFIYPSNSDAVHNIMNALSENMTICVSGERENAGFEVDDDDDDDDDGVHVEATHGSDSTVTINKEPSLKEDDEEIYPFSFYKNVKLHSEAADKPFNP
jgi:hypothetical protein